jgi:hypothetical protein
MADHRLQDKSRRWPKTPAELPQYIRDNKNVVLGRAEQGMSVYDPIHNLTAGRANALVSLPRMAVERDSTLTALSHMAEQSRSTRSHGQRKGTGKWSFGCRAER